jgi:hypothetical protein
MLNLKRRSAGVSEQGSLEVVTVPKLSKGAKRDQSTGGDSEERVQNGPADSQKVRSEAMKRASVAKRVLLEQLAETTISVSGRPLSQDLVNVVVQLWAKLKLKGTKQA